ncbi:MAG: hypothetical protein ACP5FZ_02070 [Fidelibacterota bacterium]
MIRHSHRAAHRVEDDALFQSLDNAIVITIISADIGFEYLVIAAFQIMWKVPAVRVSLTEIFCNCRIAAPLCQFC